MTVLRASAELVEVTTMILDVYHTVHDVLDDLEGVNVSLEMLHTEVLGRLACPDVPRRTCQAVDAVLQALIEGGALTVYDSDGNVVQGEPSGGDLPW